METNSVLLAVCIFTRWTVLGHIKNFIEASESRNMLTNENILRTVDLSELNVICARLCSKDSNCVSFFENSVSHQCRLVDTKLNISQVSLAGAQGWQYYVPACPKSRDYIYDASLDLCFKYVNIRLTIPKARASCESGGGQLLQIKSAEVHDIIAGYMILNEFSEDENPTVDGQRIDSDSPFLYYDGTPVTYFNWSDGKPAENEHCLKIKRQDGFALATARCNRTKSFLCQILV